MTHSIIAIDAMGGDHGPSVIIPAALKALKKNPELEIILVGPERRLTRYLKTFKAQDNPRLKLHHASEVVGMDEPPGQALRFKKDSSMRVAINLVKEGRAAACVSAGNTGALMATAKFVLKTLPGIDRPAISALLPTMDYNQTVRVLDLGANVGSTAEQLFQFAVMGSVLTSHVNKIAKPTIGLLNIGSEEIKGTEEIKQAAKRLAACKQINYIGFIEGDDIYRGVVDVVICDGFVGNVALKTSEGLARLIGHYTKTAFKQNILTKIIALAAWPILRRVAHHLDPSRYNGASFIGLHGTVIKSHGGAKVDAFANAISEAMAEVSHSIPDKIKAEVAEILQHEEEGEIT